MVRLFRLFFALLLAAPALATPALWRVEGGKAEITLYGTVHALPQGQEWFSAAARTAFTHADTLVVEVATSNDPAAMAAAVRQVGLLPEPVPLASRVPPDLRPKLAELIQQLGVPPDRLDGLKTWLAAISILGADMQRSGIDPESGVDRTLIGMAAAAGKPVAGLESAEYQFGLFDVLPEAEQRLLLGAAISDAGSAQDEMRAILSAWAAGDIERIRREFDEGNLSPELEQALLTRRNAAWATWLADKATKPGALFVAVGAAHMAGPNSLIAMLEARGLKVRRVE